MTSRMWTANRRLRRLMGETRFYALLHNVERCLERPIVRTALGINARRAYLLNERSRRVQVCTEHAATAEAFEDAGKSLCKAVEHVEPC